MSNPTYFFAGIKLSHGSRLVAEFPDLPTAGAYGKHLATCAAACDGLDLPADVEPGILADLLAAAQEAARELSFRGFEGVCPRLGAVLLKLYVPKGNGVPVSPETHPETKDYVLPAKPPKGFTKLASSADLETLKKSVRAYFGGEEKEYRKTATGYSLHGAKGQLSTEILETSRGWYFGHFQ